MPIQAKINELMRRLTINSHTLRFWFNMEAEAFDFATMEDFEKHFEALAEKLRYKDGLTIGLIREVIEDHFSPGDGLSALEVLESCSLNGIVAYYEWP